MIENLLSQKIAEYRPKNAVDQENILQELMQHFCLVSLAKEGFFKIAEFQGGTCLRIIHGLDRFSENLDFVLKKPDPSFKWQKYLDRISRDFRAENIHFEILDKSETTSVVKKAFLKTDSIGKILILKLPYSRQVTKKIKIKVEIDSNPPQASTYETQYISFPVITAITCQTLQSSFASKCHALLCRKYTKGRDWFDFIWYINKKIAPNLELLENALFQQGPWAGKQIHMTPSWFKKQLAKIIKELDWPAVREDVRRFIKPANQKSLELWDSDFFLYHLNKLDEAIWN